MTEQEVTQARADLEQLDIEQLRCGVMLQLLKIEALTKERDEALEQNTALDSACAKLEAAAKLALDALSVSYPTARSRLRAHNAAIETLRQAGVQ